MNNSIQHFTHPGHTLTEFFSGQYRCDGCKNLGSGKRYRCCHGCDFDLHEYCGKCPYKLSSFMHPHQLTLLMRDSRGNHSDNRVCRVCRKGVEGLFYWCKECNDFEVHPMCTQLPETLKHAQHKAHLLKLEAPSKSSSCNVCKKGCDSWRYRCEKCGFDIHLECITVTCHETKQRETIPESSSHVPPPGFHPPPPPDHGGHPVAYPYPSSPSHHMPHNNWAAQQQPHQGGGGGEKRKSIAGGIFGVVAQVGMVVASQMIFGTDITSLF